MRLDKFFSITATLSRSETGKATRAGRITVNGAVSRRADQQVDPATDVIALDGARVRYRQHHYVLLNKPDGVVSATEDGRDPTVLDLLPPTYRELGLFPCGRLDKHTLGLMLLTDDGELSHRLLSPKRHVQKQYRFRAKFPLKEEECVRFREGLVLEDGYVTKPADIRLDADGMSGIITLVEGKYHQIKRMLEALGNRITYLERITFGPLSLPADLARGEWRELSEEEELALLAAGESKL